MLNLGNEVANRSLFWFLVAIYVGLMFIYLPRVYDYGPLATFGGAVIFAAAGPYLLVERIWEARLPWPLSGQYASAWANDLILLPLLAVILCVMRQSLPDGWHDPRWWPPTAMALAVGMGCYFQFIVDRVYPANVAWSPSHAAHSFLCAVVMTYLLLRGAPGLIAGRLGVRACAHHYVPGMALCLVVVLMLVLFVNMYPILDIHLLHTYPWGAHGWYNWTTLRLDHPLTPDHPGWVPNYLLTNAARYGHHPT